MKALVIGGTGFLAHHLRTIYSNNNIPVTFTYRGPYPSHLHPNEDCLFYDSTSNLNLFSSISPVSFSHIVILIPIALCGDLLHELSSLQLPVVFLSSSAIYTDLIVTTRRPRLDAERFIESTFDHYIIFRPTLIYGDISRGAFSHVFNFLFNYRYLFVPFPFSSKSLIQPIYVNDLARIIFSVSNFNPLPNLIVDVGGIEPISLSSFLSLLSKFSRKSLLFLPIPSFLFKGFVFISRLLHLSPRFPRVSFEQVERVIENKTVNNETLYSLLPNFKFTDYSSVFASMRNRSILKIYTE